MSSITLDAEVTEDGRLIVELPPNFPPGKVKRTIQSLVDPQTLPRSNPMKREEARAILLAAGALSITRHAPDDAEPLSEEELGVVTLARTGALPEMASAHL